MSKKQIVLEHGSPEWEEWRHNCTVSTPGRFSSLYFLASNVLGLKDVVPLVPFTHYSLALFYERATGIPEIDGTQIQLIHVPRGTGKSTLVMGRTIQRLLQRDGWRAGIASETQYIANTFLGSIKNQFEENELLRGLFPERCWTDSKNEASKWAADEIVIPRSRPNPFPSALAIGVGGTRTGVHLDEWVVDDMLSQNLAENAIKGLTTEVEALNRWIPRLKPMLSNAMTDPITFIGTPWYPGDSYDFVLRHFGGIPDDVENIMEYIEERGWRREWQLTLPNGEKQSMSLYRIGDVAFYRRPAVENGKSIFPERYTAEYLQKEMQKPGNAWFIQAQYFLEPTGAGATEFDSEWLRSYDLEWSKVSPGAFSIRFTAPDGRYHELPSSALTFLMSIDPAFGKTTAHDRTAMPVVAIWEDCIFLVDDFADYGMGTYDIANLATDFYLRFRPVKIFIETIAAQAALVEPIQRTAREKIGESLPLEEVKGQKKAKELRIYGLQHYFKGGRFFVPRGAAAKFREEYAAFPVGQYRDILDALTFQVEEWERIFSMGSRGGRRSRELEAAHTRRLDAFRHGMRRLRGRRGGGGG